MPHFEGTPANGGGLGDKAVGGEVEVQAQGLVIECMEGAGGEVLDLLEACPVVMVGTTSVHSLCV